MKQSRSLRLVSERLADLTPAELHSVAAGYQVVGGPTPTMETNTGTICVVRDLLIEIETR